MIAIASLMLYVGSFAISLGPIFWLLNAEIYPLKVRGKAAGVGTMANWIFNFIVSLTFLLLIDALGKPADLLGSTRLCAARPSSSLRSTSRRRKEDARGDRGVLAQPRSARVGAGNRSVPPGPPAGERERGR